MYSKTEITSITQNLELHKFPECGPIYEISFELLIEVTEKTETEVYRSILTFTKNFGQCCNIGDRVPGVYLRTDKEEFHIATQIGNNGNRGFFSAKKYTLNKWYLITIKQYQIDQKMVSYFVLTVKSAVKC